MNVSQKPNVILINCDDLGYGDLGCYGSTVNKTPALDSLAASGLKLNDFYMGSPVCSPSRSAMMSASYPPRVGMGNPNGRIVLFPGDAQGLNTDELTMPRVFKDGGYSTKMIGKWHCGDQPEFLPTRHGFDEYFGLPYSNDMGRRTNRPDSPPLPLLLNDEVIQEQPDQRGLTERYADEAVRFIRKDHKNPFFLYFAHMYVHVPLFVPVRFMKQSDNGAYGGAVECIDWTMSVIIDELKKKGVFDNTIIVFTSDNGSRARGEGGSNKPLRGTKGSTWEGGIRVPCIIHWPEKIKAKGESHEIISAIDLLPTLSTMISIDFKPEKKTDGVDVSEHLLGKRNKSCRESFFYYRQDQLCAVRKGDWKLHVYRPGTDDNQSRKVAELYNLIADAGEEKNIYDKNPDVVKDLEGELAACREDLGDSVEGITGIGVRPCGQVDNPKPLTEYREDHPYMVAMYDLADADGDVMSG